MARQQVLVARAVFPEVVERLRAHFEVDDNPQDIIFTKAELIARLQGKAGAFTTGSERIDAEVLAACPQLRVVANMAVGYNNFDIPACNAAGVLATNTPDVLTETTADFGFALMMAAARRMAESEHFLRRGEWNRWSYDMFTGSDIHGATLAILGMGRIGLAIARRGALGFGMKVIYHNRSRLAAEQEATVGARWVDKPTLLAEADHLVLVLPYSAASHHAIGAAELALMKPGATLTNVARGGIVDDAALARALRERRIAAAALDVFEGEPKVHPDLLTVPNVVLTPHIASATVATRRAMADLAADNLIAALTGGVAPTPINAGELATPARLTAAAMPVWTVPALLALNLLLLLVLLLRRDAGVTATERLERELRDELGRQGQGARADLAGFQQTLLAQGGEAARAQAEQLRRLSDSNERRQAEMRAAVETRLAALQEGNEKKLEQMRATVDEKLHATLEQRLGESFRQVAERLEQVHRGLGEMQALARDVGALNRVLTNVKTRGVFGEVQLAALLEQVFTPEQYAANVATVPGSAERVEFAIRLPGRGAGRADDSPMWLPIDAKFPREDYERLLDASERADAPAMEAAAKAIETRLRLEARSIRDKYLAPPHTTDFGVLFLPTEGLYAEALRRPGLAEALQREHKVMLAGPTTLLALLNSLQMGFRTLALEKRSAEVWDVLGAVKTEFGKFGEVLAKTRKKLEEASQSIDLAETRTRAMARQLRSVEALPEGRAAELLPGLGERPTSASTSGSTPGPDG